MALSRRTFLTTALAGGAAAAVAAGCSAASSANGAGRPAGSAAGAPGYVPFVGAHQTGITHPGNEYGLMAAFTVTADDARRADRHVPGHHHRDRSASWRASATRTATRRSRRCTPAPSATRRRRPTSRS